jgi:hypothetical protein
MKPSNRPLVALHIGRCLGWIEFIDGKKETYALLDQDVISVSQPLRQSGHSEEC